MNIESLIDYAGFKAREIISDVLVELNLKRTEEELRQQRWHETYNAALTGLLAIPGSPEDAIACAAFVADQSHGKHRS